MKKTFKCLSILLFSLLLLYKVPIFVQANNNSSNTENLSVKIMTADIPENIKEYAENSVIDQIVLMIDCKDMYKVDLNPNQGLYLGKGYYTYTLQDESITQNNVVSFPIWQNNKIISIFNVYTRDDGSLGYTMAKSYADIFNNVIQQYSDICGTIVYKDGVGFFINSAECIVIDENSEYVADDVESPVYEQIDKYLEDYSLNAKSIREDINLSINEKIQNYVKPISSRSGGFTINQSNYKVLEMSNCFLLQNGRDGTQKGLCWAATAGTIIRYRTGNRSIQAYHIAEQMKIGENDGGSALDACNAIHKYEANSEYRAVGRATSSDIEIQHNINNQFPLGVFAFRGSLGHAVTFIGYQYNATGLTLMYWNSATGAIESTNYNSNATYITSAGVTYKWGASVLVPLS